jgi:hypothetical protein
MRLVAAALAVCCLGLVGGDAAQAASCGHYVKRLGPGFVPGKAAAEKVAAQSHDMPSQSPCGCRGAECRRAPLRPTPLAPAAPERFLSPQDLTTIAHADVHLTMDSAWLLGDLSGRPSRGYPLETNRPPSA